MSNTIFFNYGTRQGPFKNYVYKTRQVGGPKISTFCQDSYRRKFQRRGVGGQKSPNLFNVVCERPLGMRSCYLLSDLTQREFSCQGETQLLKERQHLQEIEAHFYNLKSNSQKSKEGCNRSCDLQWTKPNERIKALEFLSWLHPLQVTQPNTTFLTKKTIETNQNKFHGVFLWQLCITFV